MPTPFDLPADLPPPEPAARSHSEALLEVLRADMQHHGGAISFHRYMEQCLYAPGLGYYSAGSRKLGSSGDFVTAPELSPLFGRCVARQCAEVLQQLDTSSELDATTGPPDILEIGAGSGALAATLLGQLERDGHTPARYRILELSADLRQRQQQTLAAQLPQLADRIEWLDRLPSEAWQGIIIANEVLDAMPIERLRIADTSSGSGIEQAMVTWDGSALREQFQPLDPGPLADQLTALLGQLRWPLPPGYIVELNPAAAAWIEQLASPLQRGLILLIDYGFPRDEYYHPERGGGTLMCHYRQRSHGDPLLLPGLQDITAHVDFTAIGEAALDADLRVAGYASQGGFLIDAGLLELFAAETDPQARVVANRDIDLLTSPAEMGELFKVMALSRGLSGPVLGFRRSDRRARLG